MSSLHTSLQDSAKEANTTLQEVSVEEILALQIDEQLKQEKKEAQRHKYMVEHGYLVCQRGSYICV